MILNGQQRRFASAAAAALKKTPLYDAHLSFGARMVAFGGWSLPVQYEEGIMSSHLHTRSNASVFDVSHMGQLKLFGANRVEVLERLVVGDIKSLMTREARLTLLTNEKGGIKDDLIVTAQEDYLNLVVNAACRDKDVEHLENHIQKAREEGLDVSLQSEEDLALLALQGPESMDVLQSLLPSSLDLKRVPFMTGFITTVDGVDSCTVTRCGYTGEDGFEISMPASYAEHVFRAILANEKVKPAGLGVRDTLRLEAGLCLYGHDCNEDVTPVEAALTWTIGKRRRLEGNFLGSDIILPQIKEGVAKKRIGLTFTDRGLAREGCELKSPEGEDIGIITSGTFSPSLQRPIAMGYASSPYAKAGTKIQVNVRNTLRAAEVTKMPFVPASYYKCAA